MVAVTSSFLNPMFPVAEPTAADGARFARELIDVIGEADAPPVHAGAEVPLSPGTAASDASDAIVRAARRDSDLPLYVVCGGPLTNVAAAMDAAPDIAGRLTLVWVGGSLDPDAFEYNRETDAAAATFVLDRPGLAVHQFPLETYRRCAYSVAELEHDLGGSGALGAWLWNRFATLPLPDWLRIGGVWPLGDSPPVLVTALTDESSRYTTAGEGRRIYTDVDFRLLVGDLLARLHRHERRR